MCVCVCVFSCSLESGMLGWPPVSDPCSQGLYCECFENVGAIV